jgi:hypothetical protein
MESITVKLDSTLTFYTKRKNVTIDVEQLEGPLTVETVVDHLSIPKGMIGYIVSDNTLLTIKDAVSPPCEIKLYGMYDGG